LRGALREDPDVIMVGEMRDLETISLAITASETGHLVLGTLHTGNASRTLDRLLDVFPVDQQEQIRVMVSESLRGVISQQEVSIRHASALRAADNQITYRQTVRAVAAQHGMVATLAPKPWADQAGSGAHLHWSIWDTAHTTNKLADAAGADGLSVLARQAIAGVLTHLPGLLGMTTPSVNSFRRLQPHFWSSAYTAWGVENREAAVRVPTRYWDDEAGSTNLELKASDSSANPYIALGGVMAAALDGIERGLDPGDPVNEDPGNLSDAERQRRGIRRFPLTATEALDELERDDVLTAAMGEGLATEYLKVRRAEAAAYAEHDEAFELDQHFFKY